MKLSRQKSLFPSGLAALAISAAFSGLAVAATPTPLVVTAAPLPYQDVIVVSMTADAQSSQSTGTVLAEQKIAATSQDQQSLHEAVNTGQPAAIQQGAPQWAVTPAFTLQGVGADQATDYTFARNTGQAGITKMSYASARNGWQTASYVAHDQQLGQCAVASVQPLGQYGFA